MKVQVMEYQWGQNPQVSLSEVVESVEDTLGYNVFYASYSLEDVEEAIEEEPELALQLGVEIFYIESLGIYLAF